MRCIEFKRIGLFCMQLSVLCIILLNGKVGTELPLLRFKSGK